MFCAIGLACRRGWRRWCCRRKPFFTIILGAFVFGERLQGKQLAGIALAIFGVLVLVEGSLGGEHVPLVGFGADPGGGAQLGLRQYFQQKSCPSATRPPIISLVVEERIDPGAAVYVCLVAGSMAPQLMLASLRQIDMLTVLSLLYLAFIATLVGYGIRGSLLGRYETWRVAPPSLLVPVVGMASCAAAGGDAERICSSPGRR